MIPNKILPIPRLIIKSGDDFDDEKRIHNVYVVFLVKSETKNLNVEFPLETIAIDWNKKMNIGNIPSYNQGVLRWQKIAKNNNITLTNELED